MEPYEEDEEMETPETGGIDHEQEYKDEELPAGFQAAPISEEYDEIGARRIFAMLGFGGILDRRFPGKPSFLGTSPNEIPQAQGGGSMGLGRQPRERQEAKVRASGQTEPTRGGSRILRRARGLGRRLTESAHKSWLECIRNVS